MLQHLQCSHSGKCFIRESIFRWLSRAHKPLSHLHCNGQRCLKSKKLKMGHLKLLWELICHMAKTFHLFHCNIPEILNDWKDQSGLLQDYLSFYDTSAWVIHPPQQKFIVFHCNLNWLLNLDWLYIHPSVMLPNIISYFVYNFIWKGKRNLLQSKCLFVDILLGYKGIICAIVFSTL